MTRTQDEIVARIKAINADGDGDMFGFRTDVLLDALDFDHARPWLTDDATPDRWRQCTDHERDARDYLAFAIKKIEDHRGLSATRSVDKLREWAWLLCRDDVVQAMDAADYEQYGAPKVKAFATGMGWPWPSDDRKLERMAAGLPCRVRCYEGCDQ